MAFLDYTHIPRRTAAEAFWAPAKARLRLPAPDLSWPKALQVQWDASTRHRYRMLVAGSLASAAIIGAAAWMLVVV